MYIIVEPDVPQSANVTCNINLELQIYCCLKQTAVKNELVYLTLEGHTAQGGGGRAFPTMDYGGLIQCMEEVRNLKGVGKTTIYM